MSHVTNVILVFSVLEAYDEGEDGEDRYHVMTAINEWLRTQGHFPFGRHADHSSGGDKHLEVPIYVAAFNYFRLDDFLEMLKELPWKEPRLVQVFVMDQDDDRFSVFELYRAVGEMKHG